MLDAVPYLADQQIQLVIIGGRKLASKKFLCRKNLRNIIKSFHTEQHFVKLEIVITNTP